MTRTDANLGVNPGLMLTLGLCPLLVASTSLSTGFALGLATLLVLCVSGALASVSERWLVLEARVAVYFVISACAVAAVDLVMAAWAADLHASVGAFLPLIAASGLVLTRRDAPGSSPPTTQAHDTARVGAAKLLAPPTLGAARELMATARWGRFREMVRRGAERQRRSGPARGPAAWCLPHAGSPLRVRTWSGPACATPVSTRRPVAHERRETVRILRASARAEPGSAHRARVLDTV
jgi:Na+-translocating ferredoxin:NAD+ oxidoreductase RnfE subunit